MHEVFEHTADIGLRIEADTLESLFCEAALGFYSLIVNNISDVKPTQAKEFELPCEVGYDFLLVDWLNELLMEFELHRMLYCQFQVRIQQGKFMATSFGEPIDESRHELGHEIKAVTYHGLFVKQQGERWKAEVILDI